jgi:hypothetical protein
MIRSMNRTLFAMASAWLSCIGALGGCSSKASSPAKALMSAPAPAPPLHLEKKPVPKPAPRESAFSTYSNPDYGIEFRYPRNYALEEGPLEDEASEGVAGVRTEAELKNEQPGAVLVASVIVPDDSYPNTTFSGGSLQFAVGRYLTARGCWDFLVSQMGDAHGPSGMTKVQGVMFAWTENETGDGNAEYFERDYAGFSNGACYEFFLRVGVGQDSEQEGVRPANEKKILSQLEKIISSVQMQDQPVSILDREPATQGDHKKLDWSEKSKQTER